MNLRFDFACTPEQRHRARELSFYRQLACAAVLGVLPVLALAWRIDTRTASLDAANRLLAAELQAQQPYVQQAAQARQHIAAMQARLAILDAQAAHRMHAARLLRAAGAAARPEARLYRIALQTWRAELRGHAEQTHDIQAFADTLAQAGLDGVAIQDLRIAASGSADARYDFALWAPLPQSASPATTGAP